MNKKKLLLIVLALGAMVTIAGCSDFGENDNEDSGEDLSNDTGQEINSGDESYHFEIGITEENHIGLVKEQPPFTMDSSLERANLIRRFQYLNDGNNIHHVYMISNDGKVINYEVAQGKVSSVNSRLTNGQQIVEAKDCGFDGSGGAGGSKGPCFKVVESPQMDGSYGENGDAIFFFTTDGHYVEYNGIYVVSEEPKNIQTAVTLVDLEEEDETDDNSTDD